MPGSRRRTIALVLTILLLVLFVGAVSVAAFLVRTAPPSAVRAAYGPLWDRLPADTRDELDRRVRAALGARIEGLSDEAGAAMVTAAGYAGMPRLDDATLVRRTRIFDAALESTDMATCAAFARGLWATGQGLDPSVVAGLIGALDTASLGEWMEISTQAIEAEARGSPPVRAVAQADADAMTAAVVAMLSASETEAVAAVSEGAPTTDAVACGAIRALYGAALRLDGRDLATFALYDAIPPP